MTDDEEQEWLDQAFEDLVTWDTEPDEPLDGDLRDDLPPTDPFPSPREESRS